MANEKEKIIEMLEEGKISAEDASKLLSALGEAPDAASQPSGGYDAQRTNQSLKGKKLRVTVEGISEEDGEIQDIHVNVAVPLVLAKLADGIISNVVPKEANKQLKEQGIDLGSLKLGEIVEALTDLDEDIVNVDIVSEGKPMKVRVYVE